VSDLFVTHRPDFGRLTGPDPRLELVLDTDAHEGPVYLPWEDALYFTTVPRQRGGRRIVAIKRLALDGTRFPIEPERLSVVIPDANNANGMTLGGDGRLVVCEQGSPSDPARIRAVDPTSGKTETIVDQWAGLRFNSPNDVVERGDGSIWFTDPSYGYLQGFRPGPMVGDFVYRYDAASRTAKVVDDSFVKPNGIAFSPHQDVLYVTDSGANQEEGSYYPHLPHHIRAFEVREGRHLANGRLFAVVAPGIPDGLKTDDEGRVYASSSSGVQVFDPWGELIGEIRLPGTVNFTFGGADRNLLFIINDQAVWVASMAATGGPMKGDTQ
jgi:gluconolactonase